MASKDDLAQVVVGSARGQLELQGRGADKGQYGGLPTSSVYSGHQAHLPHRPEVTLHLAARPRVSPGL